MRSRIIILLCISLFHFAKAQSTLERKASRAIEIFDYKTAATMYEELIVINPNNKKIINNLALCYEALGDYASAENTLAKLIAFKDAKGSTKFSYGRMLMANGKFDDATKVFKDFAATNPSDPRALYFKTNPNAVNDLINILPQYKIYNLQSVNTIFSDMCPVFNNNILYHSSARTPNSINNYYDIFITPVNSDSAYGISAKAEKSFNTDLHDGPMTISPDGKKINITRSYQKSGSCFCGKDKTNHLRSYEADFSSGEIKSKFSELNIVAPAFSGGHVAYSEDRKFVVYSSNQPGGFGEADLWMSNQTAAGWSKPINLGKDINTPGREAFPFISSDGILYFSSDGRLGFGGLDLYSARKNDGKFGSVENMGFPMNSFTDDFGIFFKSGQKEGYFTSNRPGGIGDDDIYQFKNADKMMIDVVVYDAISNEELENAQVDLLNKTNKTGQTSMTDDFGIAKLLLDGNSSYEVRAKKAGYKAKEINFKTFLVLDEKQVVNMPLRREGGLVLQSTVNDMKGTPIEGALVTANAKGDKDAKKTFCKTDKTGKCTVTLDTDRKYIVSVGKPVQDSKISYSNTSIELNTANQTPPYTFYNIFKIEKFQEGDISEIPNIYYDSKSAVLHPDAKSQIDNIIILLLRNPKFEIEIRSHTDSRGEDNENLALSSLRAKTVVEYIIASGIAANRVKAEGFGETMPKNKCKNNVVCSESDHKENRRTEVKLLKVK
jgi:outer membrane protein OmpA-like peptidoglycan-associated protein/tetratricopeptide (TPR) repeat protein